MLLSWGAQPSLPGALNDRLSVTAATFNIRHLQILGDAAPGDSRTTHSNYTISWSAQGRPEREVFREAPVGVYSKITVELKTTPGASTYVIEGTWLDDDEPGDDDEPEIRRFRIQDMGPVNIMLDCDQTLGAEVAAEVTIRLALLDALSSIDFRRLDEEDGVYVLKNPSLQLPMFRDRLARAFMINE